MTFTPPSFEFQAAAGPRPCLKMRIVRGDGSTDPNMPVVRGSSAVDPKFNIGEDLAVCDHKDAR